MKIQVGQKYRTRDGGTATILGIFPKMKPYPVAGIVEYDDVARPETWALDGRSMNGQDYHALDLLLPPTIVRWIPIFKLPEYGALYRQGNMEEDREAAAANRTVSVKGKEHKPIAVVRIEFTDAGEQP